MLISKFGFQAFFSVCIAGDPPAKTKSLRSFGRKNSSRTKNSPFPRFPERNQAQDRHGKRHRHSSFKFQEQNHSQNKLDQFSEWTEAQESCCWWSTLCQASPVYCLTRNPGRPFCFCVGTLFQDTTSQERNWIQHPGYCVRRQSSRPVWSRWVPLNLNLDNSNFCFWI